MDLAKIFGEIVGAIIFLYVAFIIISNFAKITPDFATLGWILWILMFIGVVVFIASIIIAILKRF